MCNTLVTYLMGTSSIFTECCVESINIFRLSIQERASRSPFPSSERNDSTDPLGIPFFLNSSGNPFRFDCTVPIVFFYTGCTQLLCTKKNHTCDCDSNFFEFSGNKWAGIKAIDVQVIPFVVKTIDQREYNSSCVR